MNCFKHQFKSLIKYHSRFLSITRSQSSHGISSKPSIESNEEILDPNTYRAIHGIECFGEPVVDPFQTFHCYQWHKKLEIRLKELSFNIPTPVQSQSLPLIFNGKDLVAIASSGSGKTLSFVLPALVRAVNSSLDLWPRCLILTPTRELTEQIDKVVKQFRLVRSVCIYGGVSKEIQSMFLKRANPHIVIATPARLEQILTEKLADLEFVDYIVVDEADLMLKMGFETAFRRIMNLLPKKRQTLMFSATWPQSVQSIAEEFLNNYVRVVVSQNTTNNSLTVNKNIEQIVEICDESEKTDKLIECLNKYVPTVSGYTQTVIFVRKKRTADQLVKVLKKEYLYARAFNGNKTQEERGFVLREFQKGTIPILCATDVAARGIDFKNVKLVVNYDFPSNIETYIHRIGRTGRNSSTGISLTLFTPQNIIHKSDLISVLDQSEQRVNQKLIDLKPDSDSSDSQTEDSGYESSDEESEDDNNDGKNQ